MDWPSFRTPQLGPPVEDHLDRSPAESDPRWRRMRWCPRCKGRRCIPRTPDEIEELQRRRERARLAEPFDEFSDVPVQNDTAHTLIAATIGGLILYGLIHHWQEVVAILKYGRAEAIHIAYELRGAISFLVWIPLSSAIAIVVNAISWKRHIYWRWWSLRFTLAGLLLLLAVGLYGPNLRGVLNDTWDVLLGWLLEWQRTQVSPELIFGALALGFLVAKIFAVRYVRLRYFSRAA